jgi:hypothetical protein
MPQLLDRPPVAASTAGGLLRAEHFQMCYVVSDLDRGCELFGNRLGIEAFAPLGGPMPGGGEMQARFAWVGTLMYEIICASGPGSEIFMDRLAGVAKGSGGFAMRHHHLGFLIHDQAQWDAVQAQAAAQGWDVPWHSDNPLVEACFVAVPELPHYLEYLLPKPPGLDFFNGVPRT